MRIAFIADGRAEHARRWIRYFESTGDDVLVLSTQPCAWPAGAIRVQVLPGWFRPGSDFVKSSDQVTSGVKWYKRILIRHGLDALIRPAWQQMNVCDVWAQGRVARRLLHEFRPDIVHAFRIANEGYVAALTNVHPWILSIWGQEIYYYAQRYAVHKQLTRWTLRRPDALTADCLRDLRLAREWGLGEGVPVRFFPGNGGVDLQTYRFGLPAEQRPRTIVYARGFGPYLRFENLLHAFASIHERNKVPDARLLLVAPPAQIPRFERQVSLAGIPPHRVRIESFLAQHAWSEMLQNNAVYVSPSVSDGTPNGMLEAMACGAFPVMGDLESIREWIRDDENGCLFDPEDPDDMSRALERALTNHELRSRSQDPNRRLIEEKADYRRVMPAVRDFYRKIADKQAEPACKE